MEKAYIHIGNTYQDILAGLNTIYAPHQISNGATPYCQNVDFNRNPGTIAKRRGHVVYSCPRDPSVGYVTGLHEFIDENQQTTVFASYADTDQTTTTLTRKVSQIEWTGSGQPFKVTIVNHGFTTGQVVSFHGQSPDNFSIAGNTYTITVSTSSTFTLDGTGSVGSISTQTGAAAGYLDYEVDTGVYGAIAIVPQEDGSGCEWTDVYKGYTPHTIEVVAGVTAPDPNTVTLTVSNHGLITGQTVLIQDLSPDTLGLNNLTWTVTVTDADHFVLDGAVAVSTSAYVPTSGTITTGVQSIGVADINFATFDNICIAVGANIATIDWYTGITPNFFEPLLGLPPANGQQIIIFQNRVWIANTSAGHSRLHWSAASNPFDWTTVNDAGFVDVNPNDGDFIVGLAVSGGYLYIFKQHNVYILTGSDPTTFSLTQTPVFDGCIYGRSIVNMGTFVDFLSPRAILGTAPGAYNTEQSIAIKPNIEGTANNFLPNIDADARLLAVGGRRFFQYWLAFDPNNSGINSCAYVFDYITSTWTFYNNINARVFKTFNDGRLVAGASDAINLYVYDTGEVDEGQAAGGSLSIPMIWYSKEFDNIPIDAQKTTDFMDIKTLQDVGIHAPVLTDGSITMNVLVNGADAADPVVWSLDPSDTSVPDATITVQYANMLTAEKGNILQFALSDDTYNSPTKIDGLMAVVDIEEHQFWGPGPSSANPPA